MLFDGYFYRERQGCLQACTHVGLQNDVYVYNLVATSGHKEGVRLCPEVDFPVAKQVCIDGASTIDIYRWIAVSVTICATKIKMRTCRRVGGWPWKLVKSRTSNTCRIS